MKKLMPLLFFCISSLMLLSGGRLFAQKQGQELIDSLHKKLSVSKEDIGRVNILDALVGALLWSNPDSAMRYAKMQLQLAEKIGCDTCRSQALVRISDVYAHLGDYTQALNEATHAIEVAASTKDKFWIGNAYIAYALVCSQQGNYAKAIEYYYLALKKAEELNGKLANTKQLKSNAYSGIGNVYQCQHNEEEALKNYFVGLKIDSELNHQISIAGCYNNIANIFTDQHKYTQAIFYYNRALKINKETLNKQWEAFNYCNIGLVYTTLGNYQEALRNFNEAIKTGGEIKDKISVAGGLTGAGGIYIKLKKYPEARILLDKALILSKETGNTDNIKEAYEQLAILDSAVGNWKSAFENRKQFIIYRDSIVNQDNIQKLTQNQMQYEFDKKDVISREEAKQQRNIRNMSFAGMGVLLLFTLVVVRQRNTVRKGKKRSDELLLNILPAETAEELKATGTAKAKDFEMVTVMFTDFRNFSVLSKQMNAQQLVNEINYCYSAFDNIIGKYGIEKIKTIGDSYMCAGGLPVPNKTHAVDVVAAALEMRDFMLEERRKREAEGRLFFEIKIGIHTGPVVAGIVGIKKFAYDIWGDTVNLASRMESADEAGKINISEATYELVKDKFKCEYRGEIEAKNKGKLKMYFIN